jgi:2-keto-4-pentenoate hydratase/2-oxohepta-3-ene-1,7-dioic acid hydratase in catechol pathway
MRVATFTHGGITRLGVVLEARVIDLSTDPAIPRDLIALLHQGEPGLARIRALVKQPDKLFDLAELRLESPVQRPRKFLGLGGSYQSHLKELGIARGSRQVWFNKQVTCVNGPYDGIHMPRLSATLDYEGELAIVIGTACRNIPAAQAHEVIAGFTICNDVSVREYQRRAPTAMLGKSFDTHGPLGPWLVTPDEIANPHNLYLRTWVNGELRQSGNTSELIYSCGEMIEELSSVFTLEPGDVLATGTPAGVGAASNPPRYLQVGDVVRVEIEGIGFIQNTVVPQPDGWMRCTDTRAD